MFTQRDHGRTYLYLRHGGDPALTAVDITNLKNPRVVEHQPAPIKSSTQPAEKIGEYTALETMEQTQMQPIPQQEVKTRTIRLVDVTDPEHPVAGQVFENVTATLGDPDNHRIFIASKGTLYILRETPEPAWVN